MSELVLCKFAYVAQTAIIFIHNIHIFQNTASHNQQEIFPQHGLSSARPSRHPCSGRHSGTGVKNLRCPDLFDLSVFLRVEGLAASPPKVACSSNR